VAYIDSHFSDSPQSGPAKSKLDKTDFDVEVPEIADYLLRGGAAPNNPDGNAKVKFRKRRLSAPRPRRSKQPSPTANVLSPELEEVWGMLPKNIRFLSSFFDDSVTAHYYRGEFKETREQLIRRLLDPELTLEEVSRLLGVCPATVRRYTNRSWLVHHRTKGGQRRFRLSGVVRFVDEHGRHPER
jgi:hypothetical protein